tara:strand:+ start:146 stop:1801 length:1656 start_codon:yes stop_codon:yes gene_type:complete
MAKEITYQPLSDIGINGLNTQDNPATLDPSWLTSADNVVLRESGRIAFRKGLKQKVAPSGTAIGSIVEHNDQGTNKIFASHGTSIYTVDFTSPASAFPSSGADVKHTVGSSTGAWQFINFNNRLTCIHEDIVPQRYDGSLTAGSMWAAFDNAHRPSSVTSSQFKPSCGMGFYGRMWVGGVAESKDVIYYSSLLDADDFRTTAENGASNGGSIDLKTVWGDDDIIAIAPFYGKLVIFGKENIAIYNSPSIIGSMALDEVIQGIGCVSRDSVQAIGDDLVFISSTGLRSIARTTEKDKLPLMDLSLNIKDTLIRNIGQSTNIKATYVENEGIYIMSFIDNNITYVFDFKHKTPNATPRVTTWTFDNDREPASMAYTTLYGLVVGQKDGSIAGYEGYYDADLAGASTYTNASYTGNFSTTWVNLGESVAASLLKRLFMVLEGGSGATLGLKWYKDFSPTPSTTTQITLNPVTTGSTSLWGASSSLYGTTVVTHTHVAATHPSNSTYKPVYGLQEYRTPLTGSAKNLKLAISIESNGFDASLQSLTLLHKQGKIR